jgi:hypothetical protein
MVMPSLLLPAPSLRSADGLPDREVPRMIPNNLIYIILLPLRRAISGGESNFLPALREAMGRGRWQVVPVGR